MTMFYQTTLPNRLNLTIEDQSNRYYGDYHRVRLVVRCPVAVTVAAFSDSPDPKEAASAAQRSLGPEVIFEKSLERMGVSGAVLETTKQELLDQFLQNTQPYLARADFAARFIAMKLREKSQTGRSGGLFY